MHLRLNRPLALFMALLASYLLNAQSYPPPAGQPGTTAIHKDSSLFINWAKSCTTERGYQDVSTPSLGFATVGDSGMAIGKADGLTISLGDAGKALCNFSNPIKNGTGADFAVFENSFDGNFLELAFVEVSSDGISFFRFPSHSLTDTVNQTAGFGNTNAEKINNLAGKYKGSYGTPFDLQELAGKPGLNINNITHVKIIDVTGSIDKQYASRDSYGNKVNDPWPTAFPSGGFDFDAIGVIYENTITGLPDMNPNIVTTFYPNPVSSGQNIEIKTSFDIQKIEIYSLSGKLILTGQTAVINTDAMQPGIYTLKIFSSATLEIKKLTVF